MAIETQLYYIGTSKIKEIREGGEVTRWDWGSYGAWTKVHTPAGKSVKKFKYNKTSKNKAGKTLYGGLGGVTFCGTSIPATAHRTIAGVDRVVDVRFYKRGYKFYTRTTALKKNNKMSRTKYTAYQYRLQYKDKPVLDKSYSSYSDGMEYIYFSDKYKKGSTMVATSGHIMHPAECSLTYSDVRKNFESNANNSDGRDNKGTYVLSNVRANLVTLNFTWHGLKSSEGSDLLDTLNPSKDKKGKYNYLIVQYLDPATGEIKNGTFFASERNVKKYPNGIYQEISVTLTEV